LYNREIGKTLKNSYQKVLILGGTRGIGSKLREKLRIEGIPLVFTGRAQTAEEGSALPGAVDYLSIDFLSNASIESFISRAQELGPFSHVFFVAGLSSRALLSQTPIDSLDRLAGANFLGPAKVCTALKSFLSPGGRVVFASTLAALRAFPLVGFYGAAKSALELLAQTLVSEGRGNNYSAGLVYLDFVENDPGKEVLGPGGQPLRHLRRAMLTQEEAAAFLLKSGASRKLRLFTTFRGAFLDWSLRHFPSLTRWILSPREKAYHQGQTQGKTVESDVENPRDD
jgi:NAD(P)-dependent dehydrogenase (short-subunit alcohol dehydrogenase family)